MSADFDIKRPIVVNTVNFAFHFGKADKRGWRDVYLDFADLPFEHCTILKCSKGEIMMLYFIDVDGELNVFSTDIMVTRVKQDEPN